MGHSHTDLWPVSLELACYQSSLHSPGPVFLKVSLLPSYYSMTDHWPVILTLSFGQSFLNWVLASHFHNWSLPKQNSESPLPSNTCIVISPVILIPKICQLILNNTIAHLFSNQLFLWSYIIHFCLYYPAGSFQKRETCWGLLSHCRWAGWSYIMWFGYFMSIVSIHFKNNRT